MPHVVEMVKSIFDREPSKAVNPDKAVAILRRFLRWCPRRAPIFTSLMPRLVSLCALSFPDPARLPAHTSVCSRGHPHACTLVCFYSLVPLPLTPPPPRLLHKPSTPLASSLHFTPSLCPQGTLKTTHPRQCSTS